MFRAAENEDVTVSAFEKLSGFTDVTENDEFYNADVKLCRAETDIDLGYTRNFVLYGGSEIIQGRYPNTRTNTAAYEWPADVTGALWPTKGNIKVKSNECDTPTSADYRVYTSDTDLQQDDNYWQGATFIGEVEGGWALTSGKILWSTEGKFKLDNTTVSFNWSSFGKTYGAFSSDYGYITDSIKTVDVPGEWQIETIGDDENKKSFLYMCPPEGETAESLEVEIKARQNVINLKNSKFVNIENINTSGGGVCMDNSEMCVINGGNMKYLSHFIANKDASQCFLDGTMNDWTTESDNYITRGELGICIGGTDCAVFNTTIDCSAAAGILLYGKYAYIENNTIRDTGYAGAYFAGIFCTSEAYEPKETARGGYYIYNNTVKNTGRASFCMTTMMYKTQTDEDYKTYGLNAGRESDRGQFLPCEIAYNYFYNSNLIARDTGAYYIHGNNSGNDSTFTKLHNNVVCNVQGNDNFESGFQPFACESYFYNDAWVAGINEYDNVGFATNGKQSYTYTEPFVGGSDYEEMYAAANNIDAGIVPSGIDGLTAAQYPSGKPFAAGVRDSKNRFMLNYGGTWADVYEYGADDAILSDNAERNGAEVKLEADGYAEFKNVVLDNKTNRLAIYYKGDRYDYAELKVLVGETEYSAKANCRGYDNTYECICYLDVKEVGTYDVKITKIGGGEFVLCGLNVIEDPICRVDTRNYIIGGEFKTESSGPQRNIRRNKNLTAAHNYSYAWNLQHNPTLVYENVETDAYDSIEISVQCPSDYPDIGLELYKDSPDGTPIATLKFTGTTWSEYQTYRCKLQSAEDGGTHTYYVKVIGTGTYNLYHIRFFNEETVEETYEPNVREVNFAVNAKLSGDGEFSRALYKMIDNSDETDAACSDGTYVQLDIGKQISPSRSELLLKFRIEGYTLQGSNDGTAFTDIAKIEKSDAVLVSGDGKNETADIYRWSKKFDGNGAGYRYYRITGSRQGVMNIHDVKLFAEVEESAPGYREVNLFEEITPTCTVSDGASIVEHQGMERLYDGDLEKAAAIEKCEYVLLDLGDAYDVTALKFVYQGRNNNGYKISASADGENYDTLYFAPNVTSYTTQYSNKIYTDKKKYRYIRIDSTGADNQTVQSGLYLIELSVYGLISNR